MLKKSLLISLILFLGLSIAWNSPAYAKPNLQAQNDGVVRVFMFWSSTCGHCEYVIKNVLPPLQEQYGKQFEILMVELVTQEDVDQLYETADILGIPKNQVGVPFMLVGDQVLLGSDQISNELPSLMDFHLARGGTDYPRLDPLVGYLPEAAEANAENAALLQDEGEQSSTPTAIAVTEPVDVTTAEPRSNGLTLALVILVGMILALAYVIFALLRDSKPGGSQRIIWIDWLIPLVAVLGMGIAGYLTYIENTSVQAICGPIGDCNTVQNSSYARALGVLPVGILGLLGYAAILIAWTVHRLREDRLGDYARLALLGMSLFGTLYSIYLTYIEIWVIIAVCIWCLSSAVLMTLLMLLSIRPAREALDALGEEEDE